LPPNRACQTIEFIPGVWKQKRLRFTFWHLSLPISTARSTRE
jgi:hypothetical protein